MTETQIPAIDIGPYPAATFAAGAVEQLPRLVRTTGARKAVLVSDRGLAATPLPERAVQLLRQDGLAVEVFSEVHPNPTTDDVDAGGAFVRAAEAQAVISLGGGSALDAAKAIALAAVNDRPAAELSWSTEASADLVPALPIVAIPTTSGTGSECNDLGVITDPRQQRKCYLGGPTCLARYALLDPALTLSLPPSATAAAGIDCLTHAVESFLSARPNPWADGLDLQAVRLVAGNLRRAVSSGGDLEARANLMLAAHTAGLAMRTTGLGLVHGIGHSLGGRFDLPHGLALALVLTECLRFNRAVREDRLARLAEPLGVADGRESAAHNADAAIAAVERLVAEVELSGRLREFGIGEGDLPDLVADTLADGVLANTPREVSAADVTGILRATW
ncbi:iron-containing alcohol dehydrogenase family protein [Amycolatopsis echigonensis]|uniref:Alcohol dehydrogenase/alcohol dehydrogenase n=1 Tax=Amycolatopsis echigonensis TaxID=2576905 RepID=A0A2N3WS76_9PSEU|nr:MULTISPECIES: iron-containing alcohol dehydrogenase [Amycolatopsis]MBB2505523.1 iron-containing alcohol dehydrogenase [Amycolatopsis echigonensis]PKV96731.1 alcohol dehydrogenase/alcohol dehydrogenase [Amycolatopsis niigatensis]